MHYIDMEYQAALKDFEQIALGMGEMEVTSVMDQKPAGAKPVWLGCCNNVCSDEQHVFLC